MSKPTQPMSAAAQAALKFAIRFARIQINQPTLWSFNQFFDQPNNSLSVDWEVLAIQRPLCTTRRHGALEFQTKQFALMIKNPSIVPAVYHDVTGCAVHIIIKC